MPYKNQIGGRNGAAILGQLKADWAVLPLTRALRDKNDKVRRTAYAALRYINTDEARAALNAVKKALRKNSSTNQLKSSLAQTKPIEETKKPDDSTPPKPEDTPKQASSETEKPSETTDSDSKISWPKRETEVEMNIAPTRPLDPSKLEEARARFEKSQQDDQENDE